MNFEVCVYFVSKFLELSNMSFNFQFYVSLLLEFKRKKFNRLLNFQFCVF